MKKKEIVWIFIISCIVGVISCIITTRIYEKKIQALSSIETKNTLQEEDNITVITETARITPSTKMVY